MFVYDRKNCILDYSGAYSNAFLLRFGTPDSDTLKVIAESGSKITYSDDKSAYLISLKHNNMPVGANRRDNNPFKSIKLHVNHGDIAYATTDGYPDQFGGSMGKRLRINTFEKNILNFCHLPLEEQSKKMLEVYQNWKGNYEQTDDVHVMGVIL
jgi:serine phosphatase RsbU (regulator of sigma subunit)